MYGLAMLALVARLGAAEMETNASIAIPPAVDNAWIIVGPGRVEEGECVRSVIAIGPLTVAGCVRGDVISIGGRIKVEATGSVYGNVTAVCAPVEVAEGAKIVGEIRADQLDALRTTPLTPWRPPEAELIVGGAEFAAALPRQAVVVGGDVSVRGSAGLAELIAIGGDVRIEAGARVKAVRVIGGRLERVAGYAEAQDEQLSPRLLRLTGRTSADRYVLGRVTSSLEESAKDINFAASSEDWNIGEVHLAAFAPESRAQLIVAVKEVTRKPMLPGTNVIPYVQGSTQAGWWSWPKREPYVPADADPLLQNSAALGIAMRIDVTVEKGEMNPRHTHHRSLTVAIPSDAEGLVLEENEYRH